MADVTAVFDAAIKNLQGFVSCMSHYILDNRRYIPQHRGTHLFYRTCLRVLRAFNT